MKYPTWLWCECLSPRTPSHFHDAAHISAKRARRYDIPRTTSVASSVAQLVATQLIETFVTNEGPMLCIVMVTTFPLVLRLVIQTNTTFNEIFDIVC